MATPSAPSISPAERARRREIFASIEGTLAIEGLAVSDEARPLFDQYVEGFISKAELDAALSALLK